MSAAVDKATGAKVRVTLVRGWAGKSKRQRRTLRALGLRRTGSVSELMDVPSTRGALIKVEHLVTVEKIDG